MITVRYLVYQAAEDAADWNEHPPPPARPPWCGQCDEWTRFRDTEDGFRVFKCPQCHPGRAGGQP